MRCGVIEQTKDAKRGQAVLGVVLVFPDVLWFGVAASCLWAWFAVPLGAMPIGIVHMAGLDILWNALRGQTGKKAADDVVGAAVERFAWNALLLAIGFVIHCIM